MAKAHAAPPRTGRTRRGITNHALTRLRERSESACHMSDEVARRALDDVLRRAIDDGAGTIEEVIDERGQPATIVDLGGSTDGLLIAGNVFALLKEDQQEPGRQLCITILGPGMADRIRRETKEAAPADGAPFNPALASLGRLKGSLEVSAPKLDEVPRQAQPTDPAPAAEPPAGDYAVAEVERDVGLVEGLSRKEAIDRIRDAAATGRVARLYRLVPTKVRIEVEVEDE
jgi:hypothetical protein